MNSVIVGGKYIATAFDLLGFYKETEQISVSLEKWEETLTNQQFLGGDTPSFEDHEAFNLLKRNPGKDKPYTQGWYMLLSMYRPEVRASWKAAVAAAPAKGKKPGKAPAKGNKAAPKAAPAKPTPAAKDDDDDELDLFGSDDEDSKNALAAAKEAAKPALPKKVIGKSLIMFEVKPWGEDTDLDEVAKMVLAIEMDGLVWKEETRKDPIAYGVFKLVVGCTVVDDKVSTDDLVEKIEAFEDHVQSVDILAFNKI